jgi:hypothetical protein
MPDQPIKHGNQHRFNGPDAMRCGQYEIKVFPDEGIRDFYGINQPVVPGTNLFVFKIPEDLHMAKIRRAEGFVTTLGTYDIVVQARDNTLGNEHDLLEVPITIEAGEYSSRTALEQPKPYLGQGSEVFWGDLIGINVLSAGPVRNAWGLGVVLEFGV